MIFGGASTPFGIGFNFLQDSVFTNVKDDGAPFIPIPPVSGSFLLLTDENFLLLDDEEFLLL